MSRLTSLIRDLHRRHVWQVLLVYLGTAYGGLEALDLFIDRLDVPEWTFRMAAVLLALGLPFVLLTAYLQPEPLLEDEEDIERPTASGAHGSVERPLAQQIFTWRNALVGGLVAFSLGGLATAAVMWLGGGPDVAFSRPEEASFVAVLPFENLSRAEGALPFTDGVHDDLLTQLSKLSSLRVINRGSLMEYRDSPLSAEEVAAELGVSYIVRGGVQKVADQVRVNAHLVDVGTGEQLWAETFDGRLSAETVFDIQSTMAARIASALEAELGPETAERIARRPTDDLRAYELHVQAKEIIRRGIDRDSQGAAMALWEQAVELDPSFALAHAYLSIHHTLRWAWHIDDSPARLELGRASAERALALDPELAEAHVAMARYHYRGHLAYEEALEELETARRLQPSNSEVLHTIGAVRRRQGRFEEALELQKEVVELDPRNAVELWQLGITQRFLRDYEGANRSLNRAIELAPTYGIPYGWKADNLVLADGDTDAARRALDRWESVVGTAEGTVRRRARFKTLDRDYEAALSLYSTIPADRVHDDHLYYRPHHLHLAEANHYLGRPEAARRHWEAARGHLEARLRDSPEDPRLHGSLGVALAGLGEHDEAVRHARRAVELMPVEEEAFRGPHRLEELARVHAMTGRREEALKTLRRLLEIPSFMSVPWVRIDPRWDPLREDPRFASMLENLEGDSSLRDGS